MAKVESEIAAEGAEIIWVLEENTRSEPGTGEDCLAFMIAQGAESGLCVGDGETRPEAGAFDRSGFAIGRGFDMIVSRADLTVRFSSAHGTPSGNENLTGDELLEALRDLDSP